VYTVYASAQKAAIQRSIRSLNWPPKRQKSFMNETKCIYTENRN